MDFSLDIQLTHNLFFEEVLLVKPEKSGEGYTLLQRMWKNLGSKT